MRAPQRGKSVCCSAFVTNNGGKPSEVGSQAGLASQALANRSNDSVGRSGSKSCDTERTDLAAGCSRESSFGSPSEARAWKVVKRRQNKKVGMVILPSGGDTPELMSVDMSENRKVLIWSTSLPPVRLTHEHLTKDLPEELVRCVRLVRNCGRGKDRRIEIFCESSESRDLLLEALRRKPLGLPHERVRAGRTFRDRNPFSQTRMVDKASTGNEDPLVANRFDPLARGEGDDMSLSVGVLNVNELSEMFPPVWNQARAIRPTILAVTETYRRSEEKGFFLPGYKFFETRMRPGTRRRFRVDEDSHGVGFFVKNDWSGAFRPLEVPVKFADCLWLKMSADYVFNKGTVNGGYKSHVRTKTRREIWLGVYYLSPLLSEDVSRACVQEMSSICGRARREGAEIVIMGDLNCCLREAEDPLRLLHDGHEQKRRSEQLRLLMEAHGLFSLHELRPHCNMFTVSRGGVGRTMRDYILVQKTTREEWRAPFVHCDVDLGSDHWMLTSSRKKVIRVISVANTSSVSAETPVDKDTVRAHKGWKTGALCPRTNAKYDPEAASEAARLRSAIRDGLIARHVLETSLDPQGEQKVTSVIPVSYEAWNSAVEATLDEVLGRRPARRHRRPPSYFTSEVWHALALRQAAYAALRSAVNADEDESYVSELWQSYLESKAFAKDVAAKARRASWLSFMDEIETSSLGDRSFWQLLERSKGSVDTSRWDAVKDNEGNLLSPDSAGYLPRWEEYFRSLGTPNETDSQSPMWNEVTDIVESEQFFSDPKHSSAALAALNADFTLEEVKVALKGLPNHKAIGADGYSNEVLKALGPEALHGMLSQLWEKGTSAETFKLAVIHPLHKPGDPADLGNSRGISLLSCVSKLYETLLKARMEAFLEGAKVIVPEQGGFRSGRECVEHIMILSETLLRRKAAGMKSFAGFIDFRKAFDTVWRNGLFFKLSKCGVKGRMLRAIRSLYADTPAAVRVNGNYTRAFPVSLGVRQGGVLSPLLFLVFINDLLKELKDRNLGVVVPRVVRPSPFQKAERLSGLLWADDVVLLTETPQQLREAFALLDTWCQRWLMSTNAAKCNVMVFGPRPRQDFRSLHKLVVRRPFTLHGEKVMVTRSYKYLGIILSDDLSWDAAIKARVEIVRKAIFSQSKILNNRDLSPELRFRFFEAVIMSTAMYGSEMWVTDLASCKSLEAALAVGLRYITGAPKRASRVALGFELGYVPVHLRALVRQLRLLEKWKTIDPSREWSGLWASRLFRSAPPSGSARSWFQKTASKAVKWLHMPVTVGDLLMPGRPFSADPRSLLMSATIKWYHHSLRGECEAHERLLSLHTEERPVLAPYLKVRGCRSRVLTMIRTGSLLLNDRVSKWSSNRPSTCLSCGNPSTPGAVVESINHFLCDCTRYESFREAWADAWGTTADGLLRGPASWSVALGESAQFFAPDVSPEQAKAMQVARMDALQGMWMVRCAIVAQKSPNSLTNTPRVKAD